MKNFSILQKLIRHYLLCSGKEINVYCGVKNKTESVGSMVNRFSTRVSKTFTEERVVFSTNGAGTTG